MAARRDRAGRKRIYQNGLCRGGFARLERERTPTGPARDQSSRHFCRGRCPVRLGETLRGRCRRRGHGHRRHPNRPRRNGSRLRVCAESPKNPNERHRMKNGRLNGKVAVVTGASKGIGASIAKHLAAEGAAVIVNYASSKTDADNVVAEISNQGGKALAVQANVAKKAEVD